MTVTTFARSNGRPIDLRTDTCTLPTPEMYAAMASAPLGDDGWRDDPTVLELEGVAAGLLGKQAALFLPSGTMSDLIAVMCSGTRGGELIAHSDAWVIGGASHGGYAAIAGLAARPIPGPRGQMDLELLAEAINPVGDHRSPYTSLISMENTFTTFSGAVLPVAHMAAVHDLAVTSGIPVFLDGARLNHAAVALGTTLADLAQYGECVSLSLCKTLGAPVGSIIAGSDAFIKRALIARKLLGGSMRQSGLLAACALVALRAPLEDVQAYHDRAGALARGLHRLDPKLVDPATVETNLLTLGIGHTGWLAADWVAALRERGVMVGPFGRHGLRLVTHSEIDATDIEQALAAFTQLRAECLETAGAAIPVLA